MTKNVFRNWGWEGKCRRDYTTPAQIFGLYDSVFRFFEKIVDKVKESKKRAKKRNERKKKGFLKEEF